MRALLVLLCSTLAACAPADGLSAISPYVPPSMPTVAAANKGVAQAVVEEKLAGSIEMSDLRQTDHGPGRFMLCIRAVEPKDSRATTYAMFFDNDDYKGSRMSVIMDDCEKQAYRPYISATEAPPVTPPVPAPAPRVEKHRRTHQQPS